MPGGGELLVEGTAVAEVLRWLCLPGAGTERRWGAVGDEGREVTGVGWLVNVGCRRISILTENGEPFL